MKKRYIKKKKRYPHPTATPSFPLCEKKRQKKKRARDGLQNWGRERIEKRKKGYKKKPPSPQKDLNAKYVKKRIKIPSPPPPQKPLLLLTIPCSFPQSPLPLPFLPSPHHPSSPSPSSPNPTFPFLFPPPFPASTTSQQTHPTTSPLLSSTAIKNLVFGLLYSFKEAMAAEVFVVRVEGC